ncbi:MAG: Holliday junction branch migration protein RuvA [Pseudomonadales bacterium]|nr:Holliday junction branch migration protein RuvA [Pseudomonadales bacterium]
MIGWIKGEILAKQAPDLLINVAGVGYEIQAPMSTFYQLPDQGEIALYTHFVVREDAQLLFGFISEDERRLFRTIIKVNGVGPKLALTILSTLEPQRFIQCVHAQDVSALTKVPGIGKKTAERLLIEMRDRVKDWLADSPALEPLPESSSTPINNYQQIVTEAESALIALGYKPTEASKMIAKADNASGAENSEGLIRAALKTLNA